MLCFWWRVGYFWALIDDKAFAAPAHEYVKLLSEVEIFENVDIIDKNCSNTRDFELRIKRQ